MTALRPTPTRGRSRPGIESLEARELLSVAAPTITLHNASATGDFVAVSNRRIVLDGQTTPGAAVWLSHELNSGRLKSTGVTVADSQGHYQFAVPCAMGTTAFKVQALDATDRNAEATLDVTRANEVVAWNSVALQAVRTARLQAPDAARALAIVQLSVEQGVNQVLPRYRAYTTPTNVAGLAAPSADAARAAAVAAAETALLSLFPAQAAAISAQADRSLAAIAPGKARARGVAIGVAAASQILDLRRHDGSDATVAYVPGNGPDAWTPTPPAFAQAVDPHWGGVTPFAIPGTSLFQPPPPPTVTSSQFAAEVAQVRSLGGIDSTARTPDQTSLAHFWSDLGGTFDPPGHWNQIAEAAAMASHSGLVESAHTFALVDLALADAGITAWGVKFADGTARPVTIIRDGAQGVNPAIEADPTWTPLWSTPAFPSYISGHSTFGAAAAAVLDSVYGKHFAFDDPGDPTLDLVPRTFASFDQAAQEAGMSRIYGGIHFLCDNLAGLQVGGEIGRYIVAHALQPKKA